MQIGIVRLLASVLLQVGDLRAARDATPLADGLIHSDLPLFGDDYADKWPQSFQDADSFGCASRVRLGDWKFVSTEDTDRDSWYRFTNHGAIHCWATVRQAGQRSELPGRNDEPMFFVLLQDAAHGSDGVELWALQTAARAGSDYVLLSRRASPGAVTAFTVLQRECPPSLERGGVSLDILRTDYCAINSRSDLIDMARRMAQRPPLGVLRFTGAPGSPAPTD